MGVFLSADSLYTAFLFFEVMSFTSYAWVAHDETASGHAGGARPIWPWPSSAA